jgi:hypothetical protein
VGAVLLRTTLKQSGGSVPLRIKEMGVHRLVLVWPLRLGLEWRRATLKRPGGTGWLLAKGSCSLNITSAPCTEAVKAYR